MTDMMTTFLLLLAASVQLSVCSAAHFGSSRQESSMRLEQDKNLLSPDSGSIEVEGEPGEVVSSEQQNEWVRVTRLSPKVQTFLQGDRIEIECEAEGTPPPSIQWMHGLELIAQDEANAISTLLSTQSTTGISKVRSRLVWDCAKPAHQGIYSCVAQAGEHTARSTPSTVLVSGSTMTNLSTCRRGEVPLRPPRITSWAPVILEMMGLDVVLPCTVKGVSRPGIYWVDSDNQVVTPRRQRYKVMESGALHIKKIRWEDMGGYTCVAQNDAGRDTATTFLYPVSE